jgi:hypothetical protein
MPNVGYIGKCDLYLYLSTNPETPISFSFPISHIDDHIYIVSMFLFAPKLASFGGMVNENEGSVGIALPEFSQCFHV